VPKGGIGIVDVVQTFSNTLQHFAACCTLITTSPLNYINWRWISKAETKFTTQENAVDLHNLGRFS